MAESIEQRFDIAEGYLCSFERKPRFERRKDTLAKKLVFERKRKEIARARKRRMDERRSEKRAYLTIHPLFGGNAREC